MGKFNEFHHAYITGYFYDELKKAYGDRGVNAFLRGAKIYGEQRGNRMAMRAIRDGNSLTYDSYFQYCEWKNTPEFAEIERSTENGVLLSENFKCPWHTAFREMGLGECGKVYCSIIDRTLVRGFNPELGFDLDGTLHDSPSCRLKFHVGTDRKAPKKSAYPAVQDLEYHCAHAFWTYSRTVKSIFGAEADEIIKRVKDRFAEKFSGDMVETLEKYETCDFTYLPASLEFEKYLDK